MDSDITFGFLSIVQWLVSFNFSVLVPTLVGGLIAGGVSLYATSKVIANNRELQERKRAQDAEAEFKASIEQIDLSLINLLRALLYAPLSERVTVEQTEVNYRILIARNRAPSDEISRRLTHLQGIVAWVLINETVSRNERSKLWFHVSEAYSNVQVSVFGETRYKVTAYINAVVSAEPPRFEDLKPES